MSKYYNVQGWFSPNDKLIYDKAVEKFEDGSIFVEVGSFKGRSSVAMAENIKNSKKSILFYCVDTWLGSEEHQKGQLHEDGDVVNGSLYNTFIFNTLEWNNIIHPIQLTSLEASKKFEDKTISFVFLDAAHDYENVLIDLKAWYPKIKSGGILSGHDWTWDSVKKAVIEFSSDNKLNLFYNDNIWGIQL